MDGAGIEESLVALHAAGLERDFRREALFNLIRKELHADSRCVDVGCGTGFMVERIADLGIHITGIDSSETLIAFAQRRMVHRPNVQLHVSSILDLPSYGTFDALLCLDVIEHIEDDAAALQMLRRACRPGGKLILTVPAFRLLYGKRDIMIGHFRRYGKSELVSKLTQAGFLVHSCQFWNMVGVPAYWFSERVLRRPVSDSLRTGQDSTTKKWVRSIIERWLLAELKLPFLPCGLSLISLSRG